MEEKEQEIKTALMDLKTRLEHVEQKFKELQKKKEHWDREVSRILDGFL
jgi:hypothetical protein